MKTKKDASSDFECPLFNCTRSFKTKSMLDQHLWHHVGSRPFLCQYCGLSYKLEHALHTHQAQKHNEEKQEKPLAIRGYVCCNICLAMVPAKEKKEHILIHAPSVDLDEELDEFY